MGYAKALGISETRDAAMKRTTMKKSMGEEKSESEVMVPTSQVKSEGRMHGIAFPYAWTVLSKTFAPPLESR